MDTAKPQPSLRGFVAWAFLKYIKKRGISQAEGAAKIIEAWFDDHFDELEARYKISPDYYSGKDIGGDDDSKGDGSV